MNKFSTLPPGHTLSPTEDGSVTLFSERFQENCHSLSGAKSETLHQYVQGCEIERKIREYNPLHILEIGFGLGVGFLTTLEVLKDSPHHWTFTSVEIDSELIDWFFREHFPGKEIQNFTLSQDNWTLQILIGDARKTLPQFVKEKSMSFHAIYQDAFSPKKNPTLWTQEWFAFLKTCSHENAILSTYSSSNSIRKSLVESGWKLYEGGKFGHKRSSTRARLSGDTDPEILLNLSRSPVESLKDIP